VQPAFQDLSGRQFRQILRNSNTASLKFQQFDVLVGLAGTKDQPQKHSLFRLTLVHFEPAEVELHLSFVSGSKPANSEIHCQRLYQSGSRDNLSAPD